MKVVVTGSAGFIGGHLAEELLNFGYEVLGVDNLYSGLEATESLLCSYEKYTKCRIDIRSKDILDIMIDFKPSVVFHLAARSGVAPSVIDPIESHNINVNGTLNMLEASKASGVKRFVFSSSSSVYGGSEILPTQESVTLNPKSPYALQKKTGEEYCKMYSKLYGLDAVSLRYFNVFGPRQRADSAYAAVISSFCHSIKQEKNPIIYGDGKQFRDFTYVKNVVNANILAGFADKNLAGESFNIGCGRKTDLIKLAKMLGCKDPIFESQRQGDVRCSQADIAKAKNTLKYNPSTELELQLKETLEWYLKN